MKKEQTYYEISPVIDSNILWWNVQKKRNAVPILYVGRFATLPEAKKAVEHLEKRIIRIKAVR